MSLKRGSLTFSSELFEVFDELNSAEVVKWKCWLVVPYFFAACLKISCPFHRGFARYGGKMVRIAKRDRLIRLSDFVSGEWAFRGDLFSFRILWETDAHRWAVHGDLIVGISGEYKEGER